MRILILSHKFFPDIGGIEKISEMIAKKFTEFGHEVKLVTWSRNPEADAFPFEVVRHPGIPGLIRVHQWAELVLENNPCLRLSWPAIFFNRFHIIVLQTWFSGQVKKSWLGKSNRVIAASEALRKKSWPKADVVGNPYDEKIFSISNTNQRQNNFVFVGRLVSDKGADIAIRAFNMLLNDSDYQGRVEKLTVVGNGPELPSLKELVNRLQINDRVSFTGSLQGKNLADCLNENKFLLVPSVWEEPFGIVALEGIACGCIPIVADAGGLPEAVGNVGLTFHRGDDADLAIKMRSAIEEAEKNNQNLFDGFQQHLQNFRSVTVAEKYLEKVQLQ